MSYTVVVPFSTPSLVVSLLMLHTCYTLRRECLTIRTLSSADLGLEQLTRGSLLLIALQSTAILASLAEWLLGL